MALVTTKSGQPLVGEHSQYEREAKELAGGTGWHDSQPWTPVRLEQRLFDAEGTRYVIPTVMTPIVYPKGQNRPTRIPLVFDWSPFQKRNPKCYPVCRHTPDQCPTNPVTATKQRRGGTLRVPHPEGHRMPHGEIVNKMVFEKNPWLDSAPVATQANAGYTNFSNDHKALVKAFEKGLFRTDRQGRWHRECWKPGDYWVNESRQHRKAKPQRAADASQPPEPMADTLARLRGRICRNCFGRFGQRYVAGCAYVFAELPPQGKVAYCSEQCRNHAEYVRRRGLSGSANDVDVASLSFDSKPIGIATEGKEFTRLLAGVS